MRRKQKIGNRRHSVAFDAETKTPDGYCGLGTGWSEVHADRAEFIYQKGAEAIEAGRLTGTVMLKVRIDSCGAARALTVKHKMRDVRTGTEYNIRQVDVVTDQDSVWLVVESGVAV